MQGTAELRIEKHELSASEFSRSDALANWLNPKRFALFLGLLVFASFPEVLLGKATFVFRDFAVFSYPVAFFHKESFWRGELPLWNPYNFCGIPFLAQWNTMVLYPPTLIYLLFPLTWSLPFFCLAHMWWGGLGMYLLAHRWTGNRFAAGLAGVIFSFNGLMQNFLMWPSHVATFAWVPWVLWLVPEGWRDGGKKLVLAVVVASFQMLAGGPETILFTWIILLLLAVGEWLHGRNMGIPVGIENTGNLVATSARSQWANPLRFVCIAGLVALVCAAQLLPFLQLLANSERDARTASAGFEWSMPLSGWVNFLVPMFRTCPHSQGVFFQLQQSWTSSYYAGVGTILLAGVAVWRARDWRVKVLAASAVIALVLAFGDAGFLYRGLRTCVPALGFVRYPVKFVILVLAVVPLLAAFGFKRLAAEKPGKRLRNWIWPAALLFLVAAIVIFDWKFPIPEDSWHLTWKNGLTRAAGLVLLSFLTCGMLTLRGNRQCLFEALILLVFWFDLTSHMPNQNPTARPEVHSNGWARTKLKWDSQVRLGQSRLMLAPAADEALRYHALPAPEEDAFVKRLAFFCDANLLDEVPQTYGLFSLAPRGTANLANLPYVHTNLPVQRLLDFMGVSLTTAPGTLYDWVDRTTAMPLVTAGQKPVFADEDTTIAALLQTNIDLQKIVLLPPDARTDFSASSQASAQVSKSRFRGHSVNFQVQTPAPSIVVVSQTFYPAWKAYVDGKPAKVWLANYAFQALQVPGGKHEVLLKYQDRFFMAGTVMSGFGLLLSLGAWKLSKAKN